MKTTGLRADFAHGSTLPFDRLTALSGVEGLTVPERRAKGSALSLSKGSLAPLGERVASPFAFPLRTALSGAKGLRVNSASRVRGSAGYFPSRRPSVANERWQI